jgi:hypothetical protein
MTEQDMEGQRRHLLALQQAGDKAESLQTRFIIRATSAELSDISSV